MRGALASDNIFDARAQQYLRQHCKEHRRATETGRLIERELMSSGVVAASIRSPHARSRS